jgi:ATP-binding cassette, subfamily A (ABC1), member 3
VTPAIDFTLAFTPPNPILESIVRSAATSLNMEVAPRDNRSALNIEVATFNMLAGVVFDESFRNINELPKQLFYTLVFPSELRSVTIENTFQAFNFNWMTNTLVPDFSFPPRNRFDSDGGLPPAYHADGFLAIQNAISRAFINAQAGTDDAFKEVFLQRYPYPAFKLDPFLSGIEFFIPLIILVSFFYSAINIVKYITLEKERQLKEVMKIMGLPNWLHWTAWFAKCFAFLFISVTLITVMLMVNFNPSEGTVVFAHADWSVIWVFLMVYAVATIMFCFMWSVFFSKANTAAIIAGIMWFIFYTPYSIFSQNWGNMDFFTKFFVCLFSNTGMSFGFMLIVRHESTGIGVQWNNLFSPVTVDDNFSVGNVLIALLVASVVYLCIALYFEKVFPGEYGVPEPFYFLFTKRFWSNKVQDKTVIEEMNATNKHSMEADPEGKTAGIRIKGLTKSFAKNKYAVKNLHLNMFEDQITVLLGHNGAGKTTTMSMMTGIYQPTSGTAYIDGHDIRTNMNEARNSLGLCTQHNVLFDDLTVREHLTFFSKLKGYTSKQADDDVRKYTELLDLLPKENKLSKTLSGGMKRKLAIGISLCGGSKIVLCDEPTSGMDPSARRFLWDLLEKEKKGRTILLTTHFMDEADVLGDRIAIMADGELKCVGSSFFLKKKFGIGYRLVCVKDSGCDTNLVTGLLQKFIPDIQKETDIGSELSYILNEDYASIFKDLLRELEDRSQEIRVSSYGVSLTTLEEVFLKVGSDSHAFDEDEYVMPTTNGTMEMNGTGYQNGGSTDQCKNIAFPLEVSF